MDGGAWRAAVHGVAKGRTWLSDFTFHFHALEKDMATRSSVLAWRIPGTGEPGGLPSMGSHRVGHDWSDLAAAAALNTKVYLKNKITRHKKWYLCEISCWGKTHYVELKTKHKCDQVSYMYLKNHCRCRWSTNATWLSGLILKWAHS